jgi:signal transduction histidine kinase
VITDITMPGMDGYELCRRIKVNPEWRNIPVILLTSLSKPQDIIHGLECCADNFIIKPFDEPDLLRRLRFSIENKAQSAAPCSDPPITISFAGEDFTITADRAQILHFLLSTYETAVQQNAALHRAHGRVEAAASDLTRSNMDLQQFGYIVSHDLQEPLRMVASYLRLLEKRLQGRLDEETTRFIDIAVDGARRMKQLIDALLAYSRVGTRGQAFEDTNLQDVFSVVSANLSLAIQESGATVTHDPLPVVSADPTQLSQLLQNLVGNALKFRGERAPVVHLSAARQDDRWLFCVRDNGIGIDPKDHDRIFEVFQRLNARDMYPGTGIGLSICKKIVERHGGRIWVESAPDEGSRFFFTLPAARPAS